MVELDTKDEVDGRRLREPGAIENAGEGMTRGDWFERGEKPAKELPDETDSRCGFDFR